MHRNNRPCGSVPWREYRHAEAESIGDPLHVVSGLPLILRRSHPFANDAAAQPVFFHVAGSLLALAARLTD
jgi:hypothetical protein